nr:MAG TPA: hypothetical protein [Caudoviricetes sp.]
MRLHEKAPSSLKRGGSNSITSISLSVIKITQYVNPLF